LGNRTVRANFDEIMAKDETYVLEIPFLSEHYVQQAKCVNEEELAILTRPSNLSDLQKEWMILHDQYGHVSSKEMTALVEFGVFPRKFKALKNKQILCPSCIFGRMRKRSWRHKGDKNIKKIKKVEHNYPGAKVSTDQLVVAQPGLVPKFSGRHSKDRICGATGFIDHYSGYAKRSFENHADTCRVSIDSYRAHNGRFAEKSF